MTHSHKPFLQVIKLRNDVTSPGQYRDWYPKLDDCRPRFQYDALDQAIFEQLSRDARLSQRELGRILGENHARSRYRFKRYTEAIHTLARHLASMEWVPFVGIISGEFNLMLLAMGPATRHSIASSAI